MTSLAEQLIGKYLSENEWEDVKLVSNVGPNPPYAANHIYGPLTRILRVERLAPPHTIKLDLAMEADFPEKKKAIFLKRGPGVMVTLEYEPVKLAKKTLPFFRKDNARYYLSEFKKALKRVLIRPLMIEQGRNHIKFLVRGDR